MRLVAGMGRWCNRSGVGFNSRGERLAAGVVRAIGLMSGTSLDGVDVALIETDGERIVAFGPTGYRPYSDAEQALLRQALQQGAGLTDRGARPACRDSRGFPLDRESASTARPCCTSRRRG
jgi:1,6-anhydro-N-acetylmuramate kinase